MKTKKWMTPYTTIVLSFALIVLVGALLLLLPFSTKEGYSINFIDALFMSATSVCVTGLSVVTDIGSQFTVFGKIVYCILMEIGGLSFLTIAIFCFVLLGVKIGIGERLLLKESLNQNSASGLIKLVKKTVFISFSIQIVGALFNFLILLRYYPADQALGIGIFHAISSFNNAGLDIFGNGNSMMNYKSDVLLNISTMLLIILGGIGFIVITDVISKKSFKKLSVNSKITIITTLILIVSGTLLIKLTMFKDMTFLQAMFHSVSCRTAGFATYDLSGINNACFMIMIVLMTIGASPCSTGGGIKTTTVAVIFITLSYFSRGKTAKVFNRKITDQSIMKALLLFAICIIVLIIAIFIISICEASSGFTLPQITFEAISAVTTTGLSMGITIDLSVGSKLVIIFLMLFGRLGPLTVISMWNVNWLRESDERIRYVEENIIIG